MKKFISLIIVLVLVLSLASCGGSTTPEVNGIPEESGTDEQIVLKMGHTYAESHSIHQAGLLFSEKLEELSGGTMTVDVYANAILGKDDEMTEQVRMGTLDMHVSAPFFFQSEYPVAMIDELPFLYENVEHYYAVWDGPLGEIAQEQVFGPAGTLALNYWGCGFRSMTNSVRPINVPEDCVGLKMRVAPSVLRTAMMEELGASPITMAFGELFTALQQGTVDGQENPLSTMETAKINEVQKYLSLTEHLFTGAPIIINMAKWNTLTQEQQEWVSEAMEVATTYQREELANAQSVLLEFFEGAMIVNEVDKELFVKAIEPVYDLYVELSGTSEWLDIVRSTDY